MWCHHYGGELLLCRTAIGDICFLNSTRIVREVFASKEHEELTNDRPTTFSEWYMLFDRADVMTSDSSSHPDWPKRRRLMHSAIKFYGDGVERFESTVQTELQRLTSRIEAKVGEEIELDRYLNYSLLSVLHILMTGECPTPDQVQVMEDFFSPANSMFSVSTDTLLLTLPFLRFVPMTYYRDLCQRVVTSRDRFLKEFFTKARATYIPGQVRGVVDALLAEQLKEDNQWLKDKNVWGLIMNFSSAGYLTSLNIMKGLFLFLLHHPEVKKKIQKEVNDVIGDRPPRVEDRSNLPYTEAVFLETLRCTSIGPLGLPHQAREDVHVEGLTIPKGARIVANAWWYHHDPAVWDDPDLFRPERFLDDQGELLSITHTLRRSLLLFGVGKRACPGENFGRTRIFLYVTTLLQKFDILPPVKHTLPPADPELYKDGIVLEPPPYCVIFRRRR